MASLRQIRRRIQSVKNTQQITKAMKMVAAARVLKAQQRVMAARPYADKIEEIIARLSVRCDPARHPLLQKREAKTIIAVLITADRGLCGSFNTNLIRRAGDFLNERPGADVSLFLVGKKGRDFFKRRSAKVISEHVGIFRGLSRDLADSIGDQLSSLYCSAAVDEVYLIYNEFKSMLRQLLIVKRLLPIEAASAVEERFPVDYIYEPSAVAVLNELLAKHVNSQLHRALLESNASEQAARMTAMDAATSSAQDMIERLTLHYNKARQASITKELIEVVSGADALKG